MAYIRKEDTSKNKNKKVDYYSGGVFKERVIRKWFIKNMHNIFGTFCIIGIMALMYHG